MSKYVNDVRSSSADARYMGAPFTGPMDQALAQARVAPEHPLPVQPGRPAGMSRNRYALLRFLNQLPGRLRVADSVYVLQHAQHPELFYSGERAFYTTAKSAMRIKGLADASKVMDTLRVLGTGPFIAVEVEH